MLARLEVALHGRHRAHVVGHLDKVARARNQICAPAPVERGAGAPPRSDGVGSRRRGRGLAQGWHGGRGDDRGLERVPQRGAAERDEQTASEGVVELVPAEHRADDASNLPQRQPHRVLLLRCSR
jgi:hypothetical protein